MGNASLSLPMREAGPSSIKKEKEKIAWINLQFASYTGESPTNETGSRGY
jgi:hypothetical protein